MFNTDILLSTNVLIFLLVKIVLITILSIAFAISVKILKSWNFESSTIEQYKLEKQSYLITTIVYFSIITLIFLAPYFIFTLDNLSNIIPGAMCAAGVISSNIYGEPLLILKVLTLLIGGTWILLNYFDIQEKTFPFIRKKTSLFILFYLFLLLETYLDIIYFLNISTLSIATCCSAIFSSISKNPLPFSLNQTSLLVLFYFSFFASLVSNYLKKSFFSFIFGILFLYISYYAVIYFFGTYIYELPTHHCPFCMMQKDYNYIGYIIFASLLLGVFFTIGNYILKITIHKEKKVFFMMGSSFISLFVLICSGYVLFYYLKNSVFL